MQRLALSWLVYRLSGSAKLLAAVDFSSQFTAFLMMPIAGVVLDRLDLRRTLAFTQTLALVQAVALGLLTLSGVVQIWHLMIMGVFLGLINSFDMPGRHSFVVRLVDRKEDLVNAIALNSSIFNAARLIGPSLAGITVAIFGEGVCFFLNAASFIPIIYVLASMNMIEPRRSTRREPFWSGLKDGLKYAYRNSVIRPILILVSLISFLGLSFVVLMPVFAKEILKGGADTQGFLMGALGLGALGGSIFLASRKDVAAIENTFGYAFILFGLGMGAFAWSSNVGLSMLIMIFVGFWMIAGWAAATSLLQYYVDDDKRSRVMSLFLMCFMGMSPLGSLLMGYLSERISAPVTLTLSCAFCILGSLFFFPRKQKPTDVKQEATL